MSAPEHAHFATRTELQRIVRTSGDRDDPGGTGWYPNLCLDCTPYTLTDSEISALCETVCTSSLSSKVSISFRMRWATSPSTATVLVGTWVMVEASIGTLAASMASFTLWNATGDV